MLNTNRKDILLSILKFMIPFYYPISLVKSFSIDIFVNILNIIVEDSHSNVVIGFIKMS